jgi:hypothetical protein
MPCDRWLASNGRNRIGRIEFRCWNALVKIVQGKGDQERGTCGGEGRAGVPCKRMASEGGLWSC